MNTDIHAAFALERAGFRLSVDPMVLPGHGFTALFGPSGSGKTTLLRCFAGLEDQVMGRLIVGKEVWQDGTRFLPAYQRQVGYVFQGAALFPHLDAEKNILYGRRRVSRRASTVGLDEVVEALGLTRLLHRRTDHLSPAWRPARFETRFPLRHDIENRIRTCSL